MTLRQVVKLLHIVERTDLVEFYNRILSYRMAGQVEIPSLEEFLSLASGKDKTSAKVFDEKTDKALEAEALKRLNERQKRNV